MAFQLSSFDSTPAFFPFYHSVFSGKCTGAMFIRDKVEKDRLGLDFGCQAKKLRLFHVGMGKVLQDFMKGNDQI